MSPRLIGVPPVDESAAITHLNNRLDEAVLAIEEQEEYMNQQFEYYFSLVQ